ncbi:hypothetical protein BCR33DRAFT_859107 [Rhizoclosmatium globosum]|uniref:Mid2 domain-containing protein n=1 Tax=Rhizoclosmatium globosum TaxID=329046 RepID=A0A1Y2AVV8_9FUNG|nr:hypothetical protein BCR33DRAFT_859107 [Rhizoclosmatium globosum]|eukprot:ORY26430.1 hypothetical protein BCR33DRAFT_859107 [Rhizoclosmatium globosum]
MKLFFVCALAAAFASAAEVPIDVSACKASASGTYQSGLKLPSFTIPDSTKSEARFSIIDKDLIQDQSFSVSDTCAVLVPGSVTHDDTNSACVFTVDFGGCQSKELTLSSSLTTPEKIALTASEPIDLSIVGTVLDSSLKVKENQEQGALQIISNVISVDVNDNSKVQEKVSFTVLHPKTSDVAGNSVTYYRDSDPRIDGTNTSPQALFNGDNVAVKDFTLSGLDCSSSAVRDLNINLYSCLSFVTGVGIGSGLKGCTTANSYTITFVKAAAASVVNGQCTFNVELQKTLILSRNSNSEIKFGSDVTWTLGGSSDPKVEITSLTIQKDTDLTATTIHSSCFGDANGVVTGGLPVVANGDQVKLHIDVNTVPFNGPCQSLSDLAIFSTGTYTITFNYKATSVRRDLNGREVPSITSGSTKGTITIPAAAGVSVGTIVGSTVGSVAAVALIAVGAIVIRRRNLQKRAAAIKESEVLVAQEFVASA